MAEFLIYNKDHWMDALDQKRLDKYCLRYSNFMQKYDARYQRGDIVEVREDGFWGDGPYPRKDIFRVVRVTDMSLKDARQYQGPLMKVVFDLDQEGRVQYDAENNPITKPMMLKRCKFSILSGNGKDVEIVASSNLQVLDKAAV